MSKEQRRALRLDTDLKRENMPLKRASVWVFAKVTGKRAQRELRAQKGASCARRRLRPRRELVLRCARTVLLPCGAPGHAFCQRAIACRGVRFIGHRVGASRRRCASYDDRVGRYDDCRQRRERSLLSGENARPLCAYPMFARWGGTDSTDDGAQPRVPPIARSNLISSRRRRGWRHRLASRRQRTCSESTFGGTSICMAD